MTEDEMIGWHHQLNEHEFEQTLGDNEGQRSLAESMGSQRVGHDLVTEQQLSCVPRINIKVVLLTWTFYIYDVFIYFILTY